jgi:hypothetical protein
MKPFSILTGRALKRDPHHPFTATPCLHNPIIGILSLGGPHASAPLLFSQTRRRRSPHPAVRIPPVRAVPSHSPLPPIAAYRSLAHA